MGLQCNIDARGKLFRLIWGVAMVLAGLILLLIWTLPTGGWFPWLLTILLIASGGFTIFESRAGWCVIRAMGFKTPI